MIRSPNMQCRASTTAIVARSSLTNRRRCPLTLRRQTQYRAMKGPIPCSRKHQRTQSAAVQRSAVEVSESCGQALTHSRCRHIAHIWISQCQIWRVDRFTSIPIILCSCHIRRKVIQHIRVIRAISFHHLNAASPIHRHRQTGECVVLWCRVWLQ